MIRSLVVLSAMAFLASCAQQQRQQPSGQVTNAQLKAQISELYKGTATPLTPEMKMAAEMAIRSKFSDPDSVTLAFGGAGQLKNQRQGVHVCGFADAKGTSDETTAFHVVLHPYTGGYVTGDSKGLIVTNDAGLAVWIWACNASGAVVS